MVASTAQGPSQGLGLRVSRGSNGEGKEGRVKEISPNIMESIIGIL